MVGSTPRSFWMTVPEENRFPNSRNRQLVDFPKLKTEYASQVTRKFESVEARGTGEIECISSKNGHDLNGMIFKPQIKILLGTNDLRLRSLIQISAKKYLYNRSMCKYLYL